MYTPTGLPAGNMDRVMLLAKWVHHLNLKLKKDGKKILFAGMGNPTFPLNASIPYTKIRHWTAVSENGAKARTALSRKNAAGRDQIAKMEAAIPYADPQGMLEPCQIIATALNRWYGEALQAHAQDIFFPVGGAGGLHAIFHVLNKRNPNGFIVTQFPYYSLYKGVENQNKLHPIHVMNEPGYKLTAHAVQASLDRAIREEKSINAFLFCDPNNPLGTIISEEEIKKIAEILKAYLQKEQDLPDDQKTMIILDEAYAELSLGHPVFHYCR